MARTRKRKRPNYYEADIDSACIELPEQEEDQEQEEEVLVEQVQSLAQAEAEDLEDLTSIASEATVIEFDSRTGRPIRLSSSNDDSDSNERDDDDDDDGSPIDGIAKISKAMMLENDPDLFHDLSRIHSIVKQKIHLKYMVPWAGVGGDSTRLRAFGFLGKRALARLDHGSAVRLHAPEKEGQEALEDERANRRAICVLHKTRELVVGVDDQRQSTSTKDKDNESSRTAPQTVNPTLVADRLCATILTNKNNGDTNHYLDSNMLCSKELIAYQTNLHNGAKHLAAHLDAPLHEGFGKIIVTVAMKGSATILLMGKGDDDDDDDDEDEDEEHAQDDDDDKSDQQLQPAWKFQLQEGEAYVLSRNARNMCLHAVVANDGTNGGDRESLNLRFGLHTIKEAENDIKRHWPDLW